MLFLCVAAFSKRIYQDSIQAHEKSKGNVVAKPDDLITLPHLHEPALLHAIEERFFNDKIYTWTGPVLIAVNPFIRLPLYTNVSCFWHFFILK